MDQQTQPIESFVDDNRLIDNERNANNRATDKNPDSQSNVKSTSLAPGGKIYIVRPKMNMFSLNTVEPRHG